MRVAVFLLLSVVLGEQEHDLMTRTLDGVARAVDFMGRRYWQLNLDGVLGLRILADQLQVLLTRVDPELRRCTALHPLLFKLDSLMRKSSSVADIGSLAVSRSQPAYYTKIGGLLKKGIWSEDYPTQYLSGIYRQSTSKEFPFNEQFSDGCLVELIGSSVDAITPCNISEDCWKYMTHSGYQKYYITHEVLYLELGEKVGCSQQMAAHAHATNGKTVAQMLDEFCSDIFKEAKGFEKDGYPQRWEDLLMEQIALCGLVGFRDFLQLQWIEKFLSLQDQSGCYTRPEFRGNNIQKRKKREDAPMEGGCSSHKTSVALGAFAVSIRFMVDDLLDTQPCMSP